MDMKMRSQLLIPSVQDHREANLAAQVVLTKRQQSCRSSLKEQIQQQPSILFVPKNQGVKLVW
jgi:hypothetical protein